MVFLELLWKPGVHSRVMAGVDIKTFCFFRDISTPLFLRWKPQESKLGLAEQYGCSGGEAGDRGSLSSWRSDIGIRINFQEESSLVSF